MLMLTSAFVTVTITTPASTAAAAIASTTASASVTAHVGIVDNFEAGLATATIAAASFEPAIITINSAAIAIVAIAIVAKNAVINYHVIEAFGIASSSPADAVALAISALTTSPQDLIATAIVAIVAIVTIAAIVATSDLVVFVLVKT